MRKLLIFSLAASAAMSAPIDREALVKRHNVVRIIDRAGALASTEGPSDSGARPTPLQVGNGRFAFSADLTGLQTYTPAHTMAQWGWHREPKPPELADEAFDWIDFPAASGRSIPHAWVELSAQEAHADAVVPMSEQQQALAFWVRANPHLLNLAKVGLELRTETGAAVPLEALSDVRQELDLWSGTITSTYTVDGERVQVVTCVHPQRDAVAVKIDSALIADGRLQVSWKFPYGDRRKQTLEVGDWTVPERHRTTMERLSPNRARLARTLDDTRYAVDVGWSGDAAFGEVGSHHFRLAPAAGATSIEFVTEFTPGSDLPPALPDVARPPPVTVLDFASMAAASREHWPRFWRSGAAIDFSNTTDPRAREIERRVVLSQYLLAVQEAGPLPPQEAGLVNLGWHGKFHLEMYPWHAAHYALWDRWPLLDRSLDFYVKMLPTARRLAERQGYPGARWPKMIGPDGEQSPGNINPFLVWQQPHPMLFAELEWRARPTRETLERWREVIVATADFMAALPVERADSPYLHLGPPLKTVSENTPAASTWDPAFELSYWRFGLRIAQAWRERLGLAPEPRWAQVLERLAPLPTTEGRYLLSAGQPDTFEAWPWEHPAFAGILGLLPGDGADEAIMRRTLDGIVQHWHFDRVWGWDFPMLAMCAARLGDPERAVNFLVHESPNFHFADNGFASGGPWPYFPSNGGLLYAVALMAGGWTGGDEDAVAPGFPRAWNVQVEGFQRAP